MGQNIWNRRYLSERGAGRVLEWDGSRFVNLGEGNGFSDLGGRSGFGDLGEGSGLNDLGWRGRFGDLKGENWGRGCMGSPTSRCHRDVLGCLEVSVYD